MRKVEELINLVQMLIDAEIEERVVILNEVNLTVEEQAFVINQIMELMKQVCQRLF